MQLRRNVVLWYRLVGLWIEKLDTLVLAQRVESDAYSLRGMESVSFLGVHECYGSDSSQLIIEPGRGFSPYFLLPLGGHRQD